MGKSRVLHLPLFLSAIREISVQHSFRKGQTANFRGFFPLRAEATQLDRAGRAREFSSDFLQP